ncbi:MAG: hypothetical protein H0T51_23890 [Pirellulales bacterium]|nr:hypothetical protein [Pirellulales bacterium]
MRTSIKRGTHVAAFYLDRLRNTLAAAATIFGAAACRTATSGAPEDPSQTYQAVVSEGTPLPQGRACHAGGIVGGRVIVAGGSGWSADRTTKLWFSDTLVFDAMANVWSPGPRLPRPVAEMMFATDGDALYLAGGRHGDETHAEAYRLLSREGRVTLETLPPLPHPLNGGAGAVLDGQFFVAGGYNADGAMMDSLWTLNLQKPSAGWRPRAALPSPKRGYPGLVACGGALYLLGGCVVEDEDHPARQVFKDVYRYDVVSDAWSRLQDLPTAGQSWVAGEVDAHQILLTGRGDTNYYDDVWLVDLRDNSVRALGSLVIPSSGSPLVRVAPQQWWFIAGEPNASRSRTPRVSIIELK